MQVCSALCASLLIAGSAAVPNPVAAATVYPGERLDPSGIAIVGPHIYQFAPKSEQQAQAFGKAMMAAMKNPADFAYPWVDADSGALHLRANTQRGKSLSLKLQQELGAGTPAVETSTVTTSIAELDRIGDSVTRLNDNGVPGADAIWKTEPDQQHNRIVITVASLDENLLSTLASRFGTGLIAVRVAPMNGRASSLSRAKDGSPFWGGANLYVPGLRGEGSQCTTGFPWKVGTAFAILTAGHCAASGGTISNPLYYPTNWGNVASGTEENWDPTNGTTYYSGQSVYRGDVSLVRIKGGYSSQGAIYTNDGAAGGYRNVGQLNANRAGLGNPVCFSGNVTNYWCGMVTQVGVNIWYVHDGPFVWARNVVDASAVGNTCPTHGDSGGPVYQWRSDGKAIAIGIFSGDTPSIVACDIFFTDIWDAYWGLPGTLLTN